MALLSSSASTFSVSPPNNLIFGLLRMLPIPFFGRFAFLSSCHPVCVACFACLPSLAFFLCLPYPNVRGIVSAHRAYFHQKYLAHLVSQPQTSGSPASRKDEPQSPFCSSFLLLFDIIFRLFLSIALRVVHLGAPLGRAKISPISRQTCIADLQSCRLDPSTRSRQHILSSRVFVILFSADRHTVYLPRILHHRGASHTVTFDQ